MTIFATSLVLSMTSFADAASATGNTRSMTGSRHPHFALIGVITLLYLLRMLAPSSERDRWWHTLAAILAVAVAVAAPASGAAPQAQPPAASPAPQALQPNPAAPLYRHKGEQYRVYSFPGTGSRSTAAAAAGSPLA